MKKYKVIWFDDEYETLNVIFENAALAGIQLIGFNNAKTGIDELRENYETYDAVIADGLFFKNPGQKGNAVQSTALSEVAQELDKLRYKKIMPMFILSGQSSFTKDIHPFAEAYTNSVVYNKLVPGNVEKLFDDLKREVDKQPDTQIRHKYQDAFKVCTDEYLGPEISKSLLNLLKIVEGKIVDPITEDKISALRKILEKLFQGLNDLNIIPIEIWNGSGRMNQISRFLSGNHKQFYLNSQVLPPVIAFMIRSLTEFVQDGSHLGNDLRLKVDDFIKHQPTGYLFKSLVFQLLEIIIWFKSFCDNNQNLEANRHLASLKTSALTIDNGNVTEGIIEKDERGNYYCGKVLLTYSHIEKNNFKTGDKIKILKCAKNERTAKDLYPLIALETMRL